MSDETNDYVELATELTVAWLSNNNNRVNADDVPAFLTKMFATVSGLDTKTAEPTEATAQTYEPATTVRKSLASPDHIISMIDGKSYKTLKRHLATNGLTPAEYRERYGLKADYPMVSQTYSAARKAMAHKIGLGRKSNVNGAEAPKAASTPAKAPRKSTKDAAEEHLGTAE